MFGTCLAVWRNHHRVLSAGGFPWPRYWRACWREMRFATRRMDPANYDLTSASNHQSHNHEDSLLDGPLAKV